MSEVPHVEMQPQQTPTPAVRWVIVILGVLLALGIGCVAGVVGGMIGMGVSGSDGPHAPLVLLFGVGVPLLALAIGYALLRLASLDLAKGWLIGGCIAVLLCGVCNAAISGLG